MPADRYPPQDTFDISLLDPQHLETPDGLSTALRAVEAVCRRGDPEIARMVTVLNGRPYILECIISGTLRVPKGPCTLSVLIILHFTPQCWRSGRTRGSRSA